MPPTSIADLIGNRFGEDCSVGEDMPAEGTLAGILNRRSHRRYNGRPVPDALLEVLFAAAFSAPSKSDLQQACVIRIADKAKQQRIAELSPSNPWLATAPVLLIWCGDNRRIRRLAKHRGHEFANDHLDAFMNAAVDAGIAMQTFIIAAESQGLGCCPISGVRNRVGELSAELALPEWTFPVAGLCVGWPAQPGHISMRLPPTVTVHTDRYDDSRTLAEVDAYDARREQVHPTVVAKQRHTELYGAADPYGWSEDKARQYSRPERADFGAYIRSQKFDLS